MSEYSGLTPIQLAILNAKTAHNDEEIVVDGDASFVIDIKTKEITNLSGKKELIVGDHNSERFTFEIDRFIEGHDVLLCNNIRINYSVGDHKGVYDVDDVIVKNDDENKVVFTWLISSNVTPVAGTIVFSIKFKCIQTDEQCTYSWGTKDNTSVKVVDANSNDETFAQDYPDILYQWKVDVLDNVENEVAEEVQRVVVSATDKVQASVDAAIDKLKGSFADVIVQSAEGEAIAVSDASDDALHGLRVFGKSEQFSTTGKNLLGLLPDKLVTKHGLTGTINADGSITVNGTPNKTYATCYFATISLEPGTYFVSGGVATDKVYAQVGITDSEGNTKHYSNRSFVIDGTESDIMFTVQIGNHTDTISNYTVYLMLNAGETALPWEPYTGGIPSPNPSYPQEIASLGDDGEIEVGVYGKNILDMSAPIRTKYVTDFNGSNTIVTFNTERSNDYSNIYYTIGNYESFVGKTLSVSGINNSEILMAIMVTYSYEDGTASNSQTIKGIDVAAGASFNFTVDINELEANFLTLRIVNAKNIHPAGTVIELQNLQVEIGDTVTDFEVYKAQPIMSLPYTLRGIPVSSGGNYTDADGQMWCADEVDLERGVYVQRIGKLVLNGDETFTIMPGASTDEWTLFQTNYVFNTELVKTFCISSHFSYTDFDDLWAAKSMGLGCSESGSVRIKLDNNMISTTDELKAWLGENPVTIHSILATPIETNLSDEEITAYKALRSNYPNTTILNDEGAWMGAKYNADTKTYIDNKFAELTNAIISLGGNV